MVIHPNGIDPPMKFLTIIHVCVLLLLHITLSAQVERRDTLREAVITGYRYIRWDGGKVETRIEGARAVASPLGEGDPLRWIQALPGVSMGAAAYVRGGNVGGNIITLDGIPVYGYSHLLGLATVLPNDAIESVSFSKGGFGGNQGNFSASHIAVLSKDIPADRLHRVSNRDNTRYFVAVKQGAPWLNSHAASKSETSFLIFKAYCELQHEKNPSALLTLDDLRREFDCELNSYYHNRSLQYLFYDFDEEVTVDVSTHKWFGKEICPDSNTWDFYWDEAHQLPHVAGDVRNVKMWRKDDFDRLVEKARKIGIVVEPKE